MVIMSGIYAQLASEHLYGHPFDWYRRAGYFYEQVTGDVDGKMELLEMFGFNFSSGKWSEPWYWDAASERKAIAYARRIVRWYESNPRFKTFAL